MTRTKEPRVPGLSRSRAIIRCGMPTPGKGGNCSSRLALLHFTIPGDQAVIAVGKKRVVKAEGTHAFRCRFGHHSELTVTAEDVAAIERARVLARRPTVEPRRPITLVATPLDRPADPDRCRYALACGHWTPVLDGPTAATTWHCAKCLTDVAVGKRRDLKPTASLPAQEAKQAKYRGVRGLQPQAPERVPHEDRHPNPFAQ